MSHSYTNTKRKGKKNSKLVGVLGIGALGLAVVITVAAAYKMFSSTGSDETAEEYTRTTDYGSLDELTNREKFIAAYLEAQGGIETLNSVDTMLIVGEVEIQGKQGTLRLYRKRPNLLRISNDLGSRKMTTAFDGKEVWQSLSVTSEPDKLRTIIGEEKKSWLKNTRFFDWIISAYYGDGRILDPIEITNYNSKEVLKVTVENSYGNVEEILVDPDTMYPISLHTTSDSGAPVENLLSDYIEVSGIHMPSDIIMKIGGEVHSRTKVTSAKINTGLLTDIFQRPPTGK